MFSSAIKEQMHDDEWPDLVSMVSLRGAELPHDPAFTKSFQVLIIRGQDCKPHYIQQPSS